MNTNEESALQPLRVEEVDVSARSRVQTPGGEEENTDTGSALEPRVRLRGPKFTTPVAKDAPDNRGHQLLPSRLQHDNVEHVRPPAVVVVPRLRLYPERFQALQRFEGAVVSVQGDSFVARLVDRTVPGPEEEAEFPLDEVMPGDREMVRPGAMFYWVIGYEQKVHGQQMRSSIIRFRRLPAWTQSEMDEAKSAARTFLSFLDLNGANQPA